VRQGTQFFSNYCKCFLPLDRNIVIRGGVAHHRMCDTALLFEPLVGLPREIRYRML
jgi:hypothetical protein